MRKHAQRSLALLALTLLACSPTYSSLDVYPLDGDGEVVGNTIELEEGHAMVVHVRPVSTGYPSYEDFDIVSLESRSPTIAFAEGAREIDEFVIGGVSVGTARITVSVNGRDEDELVVEVVAQQESAP